MKQKKTSTNSNFLVCVNIDIQAKGPDGKKSTISGYICILYLHSTYFYDEKYEYLQI